MTGFIYWAAKLRFRGIFFSKKTERSQVNASTNKTGINLVFRLHKSISYIGASNGLIDTKGQVRMQQKNNRLINMLFFHESWDIMIIKDCGRHTFPDNTLEILRNATAKKLKKKYTFQADPFIIEKDNKLYVFYEAFNFLNSKGTLRCRVLDNKLIEIDDVKLKGFDNLMCHLSFPFLFRMNGNLFMIPESSERKEVILFQCIDFPVSWKQVKVLISGTEMTDNVFISHNEVCYLISTTMDNSIIIHSADHIYGDWEKITPLLNVCNRYHRGAGASYSSNNKTYFLTQGGTPKTYGRSIYIKELNTLSASVFDESLIAKINPTINKSDGVHTLNFSDNYIVYDTKRNTFSVLSALKKLSYKCMVRYRKFHLTRRHQ